jgi:iron complex transport system ATP-binding protein
MATMLEIRNLETVRGGRSIFDKMGFSLRAGDMSALIGPNGVGKTTLLGIVCGLLPPDFGTVVLNGREVRNWNRKELSQTVALVPQTLHVPFPFRVEEIVAQGRVPYVGRFGKLSQHDVDVVEGAMEAVDIWPLRHRVFNELSGGEMQRVKIAVALAQEPQLMLLDEPTQHLDIGRQIEIVHLLRRLNEKGMTILAAMHDLTLVRENFREAVLLTMEPSCFAGPVQEILQPHLLERAFGVSGTNFALPETWPEVRTAMKPEAGSRSGSTLTN